MGYFFSVAAGVIGGGSAVLLIERAWSKTGRREKEKEETARKIEFSKLVLSAVLLTYFGGFLIGVWVVLQVDYSQLSVLLAYLAAPTATAIGFYAWKTKADNAIKLKRQFKEETEGISIDLNSIQP